MRSAPHTSNANRSDSSKCLSDSVHAKATYLGGLRAEWGRNSPFAGAMARRLAAPKDDLSAILIDVRNDVMLETQNKQVPWEHSALRGRFYFNPITQRSKAPEAQPSMTGGIYDGTWLVERHGTSGCSNPNSVLSLIVLNNMVSSPAAVTRPATGNVDKRRLARTCRSSWVLRCYTPPGGRNSEGGQLCARL
jgi:hypothetical protein